MTRMRTVVLAAAVIATFGCQRRESITGSYGSQVVTGQVAMAAGMLNGSPAGVRVTVGATGMSAVLGADGGFLFVGVPEGAVLHFTRGQDGIDARLSLPGVAAPLTVVLSDRSASIGRRRAVAPSPKEIEGLVQAISATEITVNGITLKITADTVIRKGNQTLQTSDIHVNDRVHLKAAGDTALEIKLQNPDEGEQRGQLREFEGLVQAISPASITINGVTLTITGSTVIRKGDRTLTTADIKVNDRVHVKADGDTAVEIMLQNPADDHGPKK